MIRNVNRMPAARLSRSAPRIAAASVAAVVLAGCGVTHNTPLPAPEPTPMLGVIPSVTPIPLDTPAAPAATAELDMINQSFQPATLYVTPGTVITVTNKMDFICGVTDAVHGLRSGDIGPGASVHMTAPDTPGTYKYECIYLDPGQMKGKIVVTKDPEAARTKAAEEDAARSASPTPTATSTPDSFSGGVQSSSSPSPTSTSSAAHTHSSTVPAQ
jgi:plastocyanin